MNTIKRTTLASVLILGLVALIINFSSQQAEANPSLSTSPIGTVVTVKGKLVQGFECAILLTCSGRYISLQGDLQGFTVGDKVKLRGKIIDGAACFDPYSIKVDRIAASTCN